MPRIESHIVSARGATSSPSDPAPRAEEPEGRRRAAPGASLQDLAKRVAPAGDAETGKTAVHAAMPRAALPTANRPGVGRSSIEARDHPAKRRFDSLGPETPSKSLPPAKRVALGAGRQTPATAAIGWAAGAADPDHDALPKVDGSKPAIGESAVDAKHKADGSKASAHEQSQRADHPSHDAAHAAHAAYHAAQVAAAKEHHDRLRRFSDFKKRLAEHKSVVLAKLVGG
jgi:hypothetical protein